MIETEKILKLLSSESTKLHQNKFHLKIYIVDDGIKDIMKERSNSLSGLSAALGLWVSLEGSSLL